LEKDSDRPESLSVLSDLLPILFALSHDGLVRGTVDVCNKGQISFNWIKRLKSDASQQRLIVPSIESPLVTEKLENWIKLILPETRANYETPFALPLVTDSIKHIIVSHSLSANPHATKTLLVTGGCGFIGSNFINYWQVTHPEDRIINIDRLDPCSNMKNIEDMDSNKYTLIVGDVTNKDIVLHLMKQYAVTHIVHFAGNHTKKSH
jgi:hypothetical protein